jgi:ABC-type transporter Mla subunit MlaD
MGLLGVSEDEFNKFKNEVSIQLVDLQKKIDNKVTDSEENIKSIESNILEIEENIKNKKDEVDNYIDNIKSNKRSSSINKTNIETIFKELNQLKENLNNDIKEVKSYQNDILKIKGEISESSEQVNIEIQKINQYLEIAKDLPTNVENIQELIETSKNVKNEIEALKHHSMDKKSEIDELYKDIYGQDIENDEGEEEHTNGLKDKLEESYKSLSEKINTFDNLLNEAIEDSKEKFQETVTNSENKFNEVKNQLDTLLPGAMAAGLSSAYEDKTEKEKETQTILGKNFSSSIIGLIVVALIPVVIDIYRLIYTNTDLLQVIKDTPILIISIFPLYFPILWFAYSSNKKLNLSKRLIEEYTHKAVLGKTFEGLSTQIESLSCNDTVRDELRTKLLFNLLQVSSENPGKLITDYQTSDHPLMEALDNSIKLSDSIAKLNKIPGFAAITKKLNTKKDERNKLTNTKIEDALDPELKE